MFADINILCLIYTILDHCIFIFWLHTHKYCCRAIRCCLFAQECGSALFSGYCLKYLLQSTFPCFQSFIQCNLHIFISQHWCICHFTDHDTTCRQFIHFFCRYFCNQITKSRCKQSIFLQCIIQLYTQTVTKCHLGYCQGHTLAIQCIRRYDLSCLYVLKELAIEIFYLFIYWQIICIFFNLEQNQLISCFFQFRGNHSLVTGYIHCKRYQCRWYINLIEGTGHGVFSTDRWKSKSQLCFIRAQECCKRLTPSLWIFAHSAEVFLECQTDLLIVSTTCYDLGYGLQYCVNRSVIWAPAGKIWVKSISHHRYCIGLTFQYRKLCYHGLSLCQLIFSTIRHQHTASTDRTVEHLHKSLLGASV